MWECFSWAITFIFTIRVPFRFLTRSTSPCTNYFNPLSRNHNLFKFRSKIIIRYRHFYIWFLNSETLRFSFVSWALSTISRWYRFYLVILWEFWLRFSVFCVSLDNFINFFVIFVIIYSLVVRSTNIYFIWFYSSMYLRII